MLLFMVIILTACEPLHLYFTKEEYLNQIESIELIKYNNENYKDVDPSIDEIIFNFDKVETIEVLDRDMFEEFLTDYEEIEFHIDNCSVNEPTGYCLVWYLKNGNFIVFSCTGTSAEGVYSMCSEFDSESKFIKHYADFAARPHYDMILDKYFENYNIDWLPYI